MNNLQFTKKTILALSASLFIVCCLLFAGIPAFAQDPTPYTLLEPLPTVNSGGETTTASEYISGLFTLAIGVAGVLAVLMIIFGGIKYMSTDAFSGKNEAKDTISNALWGLALAMGAWMILNTINPDLVGFDLRLDRQTLPTPSGGTGGTGGTGSVPLSCNNCVAISVPIAPGNVCSGGGACTINATLNNKLIALNSAYSGAFEVTEAWPPTRPHENDCHRLGTCVDIGLGLGRNRAPQDNPQNIISFISAANAAGLRAVFEVPTTAQMNALISAGVPAANIDDVSGVSPHFSVYNQ